MRINDENKSVDMEQRDINFTMPPYIRNYQFLNKNELPDKIIFPMFQSVNIQGADGKMHLIAIEYIAPDSPVAVEIAKDGAGIQEITPAQEVVLDEKDEEIKRLKAEVAALTPTGRGGEDEVGGTTILSDEELAKLPNPIDSLQIDVEKADGIVVTLDSSPARAAFAETTSPEPRIPKQPPGGDIGPGQPLSDTHPRDSRDQTMTAKALQPEAEIKEEEEKPFEKKITRDETGKPIVEDKSDA